MNKIHIISYNILIFKFSKISYLMKKVLFISYILYYNLL